MPSHEFSMKELSVTAIVTFMISGMGGMLFQSYLHRAKPIIHITSLGFEGDTIELDSPTLEASAATPWGRRLNRFEDFERLLEREKSASRIILELRTAKESADAWLNPIKTNKRSGILTRAEVLETPYIATETNIMGIRFQGLLRRRDLPDLPVPLDTVKNEPRLWPLRSHDEGWSLHIGYARIEFETDKEFSDKEIKQQELIAESFARGVLQNLVFIHDHFSEKVASEIVHLQTLQTFLRKELLAQARLSVRANISNTGGTPIILQPYFSAIAILGEDQLPFDLQVVQVSGSADLSNQLSNPEQHKRKSTGRFHVKPYLQQTRACTHKGATHRGGGVIQALGLWEVAHEGALRSDG